MSKTPLVDEVLSHQGATPQDVITRLERLISLARELEEVLRSFPGLRFESEYNAWLFKRDELFNRKRRRR